MWTEEHRRIYRRERGGPSDLRDAVWARLAPLIPPASPGGRSRKTDMRAAMNAILYLLRTGCPWRYLPRDGFPPSATVYNIFRKLHSAREHGRRSGLNCTWHCVTEWAARPALRPRFSTASRSVGEIGGKRGGKDHAVGYDAGKKVKGHKIHVLVDAEGLPMRVVVHSAAIQDLVGYAIAETIERHDRTRFEVLGYSYGPDDASGLRRRFERAFDLIVDLSPRRVSLAMLRSRKWAAQKHWRSLFFSENLEFCTWRLCLAHANC